MTRFIQESGLDLVYQSGFYSEDRADAIFQYLSTIEFNTDEQSAIRIGGEYRQIPRKQVAFGDPGTRYHFSGISVPAREWTAELLQIRDEVTEYLIQNSIIPPELRINFMLINLYRTGADNIGPHSDDERDLVEVPSGANGSGINNPGGAVISSLSFGATRDFRFTKKISGSGASSFTIPLKHGDLAIMRGTTQRYWKHSIPPRARVTEPRFNITLRILK